MKIYFTLLKKAKVIDSSLDDLIFSPAGQLNTEIIAGIKSETIGCDFSVLNWAERIAQR